MSRDWQRLADSIEAARAARGMTQVQLAEAAGVSESTIQNLESGKDRSRLPHSLPKIERVLGWKEGSGKAVLDGGTPEQVIDHNAAENVTAKEAGSGELPLRIVHALSAEAGPLLDATVLDLTPLGSDARMIVVVKGKPDASPEQIRKDLLAWERAQRRLQNLDNTANDHDGDGSAASEA